MAQYTVAEAPFRFAFVEFYVRQRNSTWIRGSSTKKARHPDHFLDLGRLGFSLEPLIQGKGIYTSIYKMINNLSSICSLNQELLTAETSAGTLIRTGAGTLDSSN